MLLDDIEVLPASIDLNGSLESAIHNALIRLRPSPPRLSLFFAAITQRYELSREEQALFSEALASWGPSTAITSLAHLPDARAALAALQADGVTGSQAPGDLLARGICQLKLGQFDAARRSLGAARDAAPLDPDITFYSALANAAGARPMALDLQTGAGVDSGLRSAVTLSPQSAEPRYLWAVFRYDFFVMNGLRFDPPPPDELIGAAGRLACDNAYLGELLGLLRWPSSGPTRAFLRLLPSAPSARPGHS